MFDDTPLKPWLDEHGGTRGSSRAWQSLTQIIDTWSDESTYDQALERASREVDGWYPTYAALHSPTTIPPHWPLVREVWLSDDRHPRTLQGWDLDRIRSFQHHGDPELDDLTELPELPRLESLRLNSKHLRSLAGVDRFPALKELRVGSDALEDLRPLEGAAGLCEIGMRAPRVHFDPGVLRGLRALEKLTVDETGFVGHVAFPGLPALNDVTIRHCRGARSMSFLGAHSLERLTVVGMSSLRTISGLAGMPKLVWLDLSECRALRELDALPTTVRTLNLFDCASLEALPGLHALDQLTTLDLTACERMIRPDGVLRGREAVADFQRKARLLWG